MRNSRAHRGRDHIPAPELILKAGGHQSTTGYLGQFRCRPESHCFEVKPTNSLIFASTVRVKKRKLPV